MDRVSYDGEIDGLEQWIVNDVLYLHDASVDLLHIESANCYMYVMVLFKLVKFHLISTPL